MSVVGAMDLDSSGSSSSGSQDTGLQALDRPTDSKSHDDPKRWEKALAAHNRALASQPTEPIVHRRSGYRLALAVHYILMVILPMLVFASAVASTVAMLLLVEGIQSHHQDGDLDSKQAAQKADRIQRASYWGAVLACALPHGLMLLLLLLRLMCSNGNTLPTWWRTALESIRGLCAGAGVCALCVFVLPLLGPGLASASVLPAIALPGVLLAAIQDSQWKQRMANGLSLLLLSACLAVSVMGAPSGYVRWALPVAVGMAGSASVHESTRRYADSPQSQRTASALISHLSALFGIVAVAWGLRVFNTGMIDQMGLAQDFTNGMAGAFQDRAVTLNLLLAAGGAFSAYLFSWLGCCLCMPRASMASPTLLAVITSMALAWAHCHGHISSVGPLDIADHKHQTCQNSPQWAEIGAAIFGALGLALATRHVWWQRYFWVPLESTVWCRPEFFSLILAPAMLMNRVDLPRNARPRPPSRNAPRATIDTQDSTDTTPSTSSKKSGSKKKKTHSTRVILCTTMWHETDLEMRTLLASLLKLDAHQAKDTLYEAHLFVDNAFEPDGSHNEYVQLLISLIADSLGEGASHIMRRTPYGQRLEWCLGKGMPLMVHLKDSTKIAPKKRWSQVMYMLYVLYYRMQADTDFGWANTFVLTTDGDVDFSPTSVRDLQLYLQRDRAVGAVCGRIHPKGSGPLVWFQVYEYALGHWFQKTAEHVLGSVLCCPGCFSMFRGEALADVVHEYSQLAVTAKDFLQFDQGEDRWLSTLLLKKGWSLEYCAAADAETFCPEDFREFFNQRRRWISSTIANLQDLLLSNGGAVVKANSTISYSFIAYQIILLICTLLSPAIVLLVVVGGLSFAFGWDSSVLTITGSLLILCYVAVCCVCSNRTQVRVSLLLSVLSSCIMAAVVVGLCSAMVHDLTNPNSFFVAFIATLFIMAAAMHPHEFWCLLCSWAYVLAIPSAYILLVIFSVCNLHVVSWGTREKPDPNAQSNGSAVNGGPAAANEPGKHGFQISTVIGGQVLCLSMGRWYLKWSYGAPPYHKVEEVPLTATEGEPMNHPLVEDKGKGCDPDSNRVDPTLDDPKDDDGPTPVPKALGGDDQSISHGVPEDERFFWTTTLAQYLAPDVVKGSATDHELMIARLHDLRRMAVFWLVLLNTLWVVAITSLAYQQHLQVFHSNALGLGLLAIFTVVLLVQFIAMAYHRMATAVHIVATAPHQKKHRAARPQTSTHPHNQ